MTMGIPKASAVLIIFSKTYEECNTTRPHAEFLIQSKKQVIFIKGEKDYNPKDLLGLLIRSANYIDLSGINYEDGWKKLIFLLQKQS